MFKVAISGKANSGKNTLGKILIEEIQRQWEDEEHILPATHIAFADPIKKMALLMFPQMPSEYVFGSSKYRNEIIPNAFKDGKPLTVRQLLLDLGTAVGRGYNDNIWLDNFDIRLQDVYRDRKIVILTDARFPNEIKHLKQKDFYLIRLFRNQQASINHVSETGQDSIQDSEFDYILHNNASLEMLRKEVKTHIIPKLRQ